MSLNLKVKKYFSNLIQHFNSFYWIIIISIYIHIKKNSELILPNAFIWSSLTLRDPSYIMNRWTNGNVEKFIGTRKRAGKNFEPAEYIINQKNTHKHLFPLIIQNFPTVIKKIKDLENNNLRFGLNSLQTNQAQIRNGL